MKVYILDNSPFNAEDINNWNSYQEIHGTLTENAKTFIRLARKEGIVYDLRDFVDAFNFELINPDSFIFITNLE